MRLREPRTTGLIFSSGKIVCLGAKTEEESKKAVLVFAGHISKALEVKIPKKVETLNFKIHNVVASHEVGFRIKL